MTPEDSAILPTYGRADISFVRGEGSHLFTASGDAYLDFASGLAVNIFGHNDPALNDALITQARKLWHTSNLYRIDGQEKLAKRLANLAKLDQVFFCNSGAEANEAAIKIARRFHHENSPPPNTKNAKARTKIICTSQAFHGRTLAMLAATDKPPFRTGFGPMPSDFMHVPFGNLNHLRGVMSDEIAAIMVEPIQGEGGVNTASTEYMQGLRAAADEFGALLIVDEVQTGMYRTGKFFAYQHSQIQPDLITLAKGLGGGFPIGAVITHKKIGDAMGPGSHGSTFGGNFLAMAVANAVIDRLEHPYFLPDLNTRITMLDQHLNALAKAHPQKIDSLRGIGFLRGIQLNPSLTAAEFTAQLRENRLLVVPASNNVVRLLPPLNASQSELAQACTLIDQQLQRA